MSIHILVLEDEEDFREGLVEILKLEGFSVDCASTITSAKNLLSKYVFDIIIIDRNLPDGDGLETLKFLPDPNKTGTIVLTCEGQKHDRIAGINANADYYLVKPFPVDELLAIINRIQRRFQGNLAENSYWTLDKIRWELKSPSNFEIELTKSEFALMCCFIGKSGTTISRDEIIKGLGFNPLGYDNRRLEVLLRRLRKKIEDAGIPKFPLQTVYGVGLAFTEKLKIN